MRGPQRDTVGVGTAEFAASLLVDLYVSLRRNLQRWAAVTHQTPQARMGYVGQHLVSVVTGFPGGRSGARGDDLKLPGGGVGEIKCCYRVDQLGVCKHCGTRVASIETLCPSETCGSRDIVRKDDSKWLLSPKSESELKELFLPRLYYLVLFEFADLAAATDINVQIFTVDPRNLGFRLCMVDYYFNIRSNSKSAAPFNLWPGSLKFSLMKPELIYWSVIKPNDSVETKLFPGRDKAQLHAIAPLKEYANSDTLSDEAIEELLKKVGLPRTKIYPEHNRRKRREGALEKLQEARIKHGWDDAKLADTLAKIIYGPKFSEEMYRWSARHLP
ncbi:MamI family restriction endonuclease [Frateuria sp. Soil773]|uniref:MamI family restriction endonuclease n=1 Tax=Frateuria sp. Soil773 TaxID=1736407 RepID=UPI000A9D07E9|nr:MamI family restriction endonuclease [Frateuria sp. Soil773]